MIRLIIDSYDFCFDGGKLIVGINRYEDVTIEKLTAGNLVVIELEDMEKTSLVRLNRIDELEVELRDLKIELAKFNTVRGLMKEL